MPSDTRRFALAPDVVLQHAGEESLLVNLADENLFALNETAAVIVQKLADGVALDALVDALAREYETPSGAVASDVLALVRELEHRGLLVEREAA